MAGAAGLLLVGVVDLGAPGDRLAISHLRRADIDLDLVGALQDVDLDVEMELAHALDDRLARLLVRRNVEGWILGRKLVERQRHLLLVALGLRLDRHLDHRIGKFHPLEDHRLGGVAQRVAGARVLQSDQRDDVAGIGLGDLLAGIGMHQHHAADPLGLASRRIEDGRSLVQPPGIDPAEGQDADTGSSIILKASIDSGSSSVERAHDFGIRSRGSIPLIGGTSTGDGR